jgi:pyridoxamine 5'-phosphate oxidase
MSDAVDPDRHRPHAPALERHTDYGAEHLLDDELADDPIDQFTRWLTEADERGVYEPNAMVLGTIDPDGTPSARTVLLRGVDARGFTFYTDHGSRKGRALHANPAATLVFPWYALHRQVIVTGQARSVPAEESDAYWAGRPRGSRIAGAASEQSHPIASREALDAKFAAMEEGLAVVDDVPRPERWGGFRVEPQRIEFWQGRTSRRHDRLVFTRTAEGEGGSEGGSEGEGWRVERLQP